MEFTHNACFRYSENAELPPILLVSQIEDKKLKGRLRYTESVVRDAQAQAAQVEEWLLPAEAGSLEAEGMERTWRFQQKEIVEAVDTGIARKVFDLSLPSLGPYTVDCTRSGRHMLLGGRKGHLALIDRERLKTVCEVQVGETVRDVKFLHNETFFAAAQKQYVYIYDKRGIEVHCLKVGCVKLCYLLFNVFTQRMSFLTTLHKNRHHRNILKCLGSISSPTTFYSALSAGPVFYATKTPLQAPS